MKKDDEEAFSLNGCIHSVYMYMSKLLSFENKMAEMKLYYTKILSFSSII